MPDTAKIMFEIFRVPGASCGFHVVYFTELDEHDCESGINQALAGERFFDGFIAERNSDQAKDAIANPIERLDQGEVVDHAQVQTVLTPHLVS